MIGRNFYIVDILLTNIGHGWYGIDNLKQPHLDYSPEIRDLVGVFIKFSFKIGPVQLIK